MNTFEGGPQKNKPEFRPAMVEKIQSWQIKRIAPELFELARKIVETRKTYDLILSDDASGRLVSLFLQKILGAVREKNGLPKTDVKFVSSGRRADETALDAAKKMLEDMAPERTLIATEYIEIGRSMRKLIPILQELGLKFDVASLSIKDESALESVRDLSLHGTDKSLFERMKKSFSSKPASDAEIYYGAVGSQGVDMHDRRLVSGVYTDPSGVIKKTISAGYGDEEKQKIQTTINRAREDVDLLAQETLKELGI